MAEKTKTMEDLIQNLRKNRERLMQDGGPERLAKQKAEGR